MRSNTGYITQVDKSKTRARCRKWQLRFQVGKDESGKYHYRTRRFEGTYREAQQALKEFVDEIEGGMAVGANGLMKAKDYFEAYHAARIESGNYTARSLRAERNTMVNFIDALGEKRMKDVTAADLEALYAKLRREGGRSGKPLSQTSIVQLHRYVKSMFNHAKRRGDIPPNSLQGLRPPKARKKEKKALADEEAVRLADRLRQNDPKCIAALLCLECGLRRSEALALDWEHVKDGCVEVVASMEDDGSIGPPKTEAGFRKVPVPKKTWERLMVWKFEQGGFFESGFVCSYDGRPITPPSLTCWWIRKKSSFGVECSLHELRHTYVTRLIRAKVNPRVVQKLAGHSSSTITLEVYSHVEEDDLRDAVCILD